jgi:probable F420-dependent oxidoreductase
MKIWLALPFLSGPEVLDLAQRAQAHGVHGVALSDHVGVPARIESVYPYTGQPGRLAARTEFPDPLILAAALGQQLPAPLRFMTNALIVPLRHPLDLARQAATAAVLTGGRLDLGVGAGWMREEFEALGIGFARRGQATDETLTVLRRLWTGEFIEHRGSSYAFEPIALHPVPPQPIPILVGGLSPRAIERAAALGDGWLGLGLRLDELGDVLSLLMRARRQGPRAETGFEIRTSLAGRVDEDSACRAAELGVDGLVVELWQLASSGTARADATLDRVGGRLGRVVAAADSVRA